MSDLEVVEAAHAAICEDSLADCLEWGGRCVKSVKAAAPFLRAQALEDAAQELATRSETFLKTMQNMADSREYKLEDIVRYGAFSAEANSTANRLRNRAATERGQG
ncbi:hypothetical protein [Arthrobacter bambusae]|uniref:hypothetical protein n=1 Tax=Arthrobacter bambusae TaxID=1338426 RepID=UPI0027812AED|nr:hypothetical protein [Arthrobacter bambusae]MDQ0241206.1 hypothetical protein [Arthrobacter bambusae]